MNVPYDIRVLVLRERPRKPVMFLMAEGLKVLKMGEVVGLKRSIGYEEPLLGV